MSMNKRRWSPDTCECVIWYQWDDSLPQDQLVFSLESFEYMCDAHNRLEPDQAYQAIRFGENLTKNLVQNHLMENLDDHVEIEKSGARKWADGVEFNFDFDANRNLLVSIDGAAPVDKATLQAIIDQKFKNGEATAE